jgi:serine/threonine protein kinase
VIGGPAPPDEVLIAEPLFEQWRFVAEGGAGRVWAAFDTGLQRWVAVKVSPDPGAMAEARTAARVSHPRVLAVHRATVVDGATVIISELAGETLSERCRREPLSNNEVLVVASDLLDAIIAVHRAGLLHLDVKPANVLVVADGTIRLADFGLAQQAQGARATGTGTRGFGAPEQFDPAELLDASADLYAWASTVRALSGSGPALPTSFAALLEACDAPPPKRPSAASIRGTLDDLLLERSAAGARADRRAAIGLAAIGAAAVVSILVAILLR